MHPTPMRRAFVATSDLAQGRGRMVRPPRSASGSAFYLQYRISVLPGRSPKRRVCQLSTTRYAQRGSVAMLTATPPLPVARCGPLAPPRKYQSGEAKAPLGIATVGKPEAAGTAGWTVPRLFPIDTPKLRRCG